MRESRAAWRFGVSVRQFREFEAGMRSPSFETWDRICKLYGWPQTFVGVREVSDDLRRLTTRAGSGRHEYQAQTRKA